MDWAHMTHKILTSRGRFMVHISSSSIGIITPRHHQHQHMDRVEVMNQNSRPILPLSHSWKAAFPARAHIYTKMITKPKVCHLIFGLWSKLWVSLEKFWESWFGGLRGMFSKGSSSLKLIKKYMLLSVFFPTPWTLTSLCVVGKPLLSHSS